MELPDGVEYFFRGFYNGGMVGEPYIVRRLAEILNEPPSAVIGRRGIGPWTQHPDYNCWRKMRSRCNDPKNQDYRHYGGKGIRVCPAWDSFLQFARDMGPRPTPKHTIGRIDNAKGYEAGNCRWETMAEQNRNRTKYR